MLFPRLSLSFYFPTLFNNLYLPYQHLVHLTPTIFFLPTSFLLHSFGHAVSSSLSLLFTHPVLSSSSRYYHTFYIFVFFLLSFFLSLSVPFSFFLSIHFLSVYLLVLFFFPFSYLPQSVFRFSTFLFPFLSFLNSFHPSLSFYFALPLSPSFLSFPHALTLSSHLILFNSQHFSFPFLLNTFYLFFFIQDIKFYSYFSPFISFQSFLSSC